MEDEKKVILDSIGKIHYHQDFDDPSKYEILIATMPRLEDYETKKAKVQRRKRCSKGTYYEAIFMEPLLLPEQELHLFKKLNFLKFLAKRHAEESTLEIAQNYCNKIVDLRNLLALANVRLVVNQCKRVTTCEGLVREELSSFLLLKLIIMVESFDWTKGFRFNTYVYKSLQSMTKEFFRKSYKKEEELDEEHLLQEDDEELASEINEYNTRLENAVDFLIGTSLDKIRKDVVYRHFGLRGHEQMPFKTMVKHLPKARAKGSNSYVNRSSGKTMTIQNASRIYREAIEWMRDSIKLLPEDIAKTLKEHKDGDHQIPLR